MRFSPHLLNKPTINLIFMQCCKNICMFVQNILLIFQNKMNILLFQCKILNTHIKKTCKKNYDRGSIDDFLQNLKIQFNTKFIFFNLVEPYQVILYHNFCEIFY